MKSHQNQVIEEHYVSCTEVGEKTKASFPRRSNPLKMFSTTGKQGQVPGADCSATNAAEVAALVA